MSIEKKCIVANWKLNKNRIETRAFFSSFLPLIGEEFQCDVFIAPSFTSLETALQATSNTPIQIGAQNVAEMSDGAYTGEISASMLKECGASFTLIGHSERRTLFGESDERIRCKVERATEAALPYILCVGETLEEKEAGKTHAVIEAQIRLGLERAKDASLVTIAYEPVWAIGTGKTATPDEAQAAHATVRELLIERFNEAGRSIRILYGGSVKPGNTNELLSEPDIDGCLVGGCSLDPKEFHAIIAVAEKCCS